jgi:hypothetical protein
MAQVRSAGNKSKLLHRKASGTSVLAANGVLNPCSLRRFEFCAPILKTSFEAYHLQKTNFSLLVTCADFQVFGSVSEGIRLQ